MFFLQFNRIVCITVCSFSQSHGFQYMFHCSPAAINASSSELFSWLLFVCCCCCCCFVLLFRYSFYSISIGDYCCISRFLSQMILRTFKRNQILLHSIIIIEDEWALVPFLFTSIHYIHERVVMVVAIVVVKVIINVAFSDLQPFIYLK